MEFKSEGIRGQDEAGSRTLARAHAYTSFRSAAFPEGLPLLVVNAAKVPLTPHGVHDATTNSTLLAHWLERWPAAELALAVPASVVVLDLDRKHGEDGYRDFERFDGRDPHLVETPQALSPSGGAHLFFTAAQAYPNKVKLKRTGVDIRSKNGYVVLPGPDNGRRWIKRLSTTPLEPAPAWLANVVQDDRPVPELEPITSRKEALAVLKRAVARIIGAPAGEQENTRHGQCFRIGALIAEGALDYAIARQALIAAAEAMSAHGAPWRDLEAKVEASLERGMLGGGAP